MNDIKLIVITLVIIFGYILISSLIHMLSIIFLLGLRSAVSDFDRALEKKVKHQELSKDFHYDDLNKSIIEKSEKNIDNELRRCFDNVKAEKSQIDSKIIELISSTDRKRIQLYMKKLKNGRSGKAYQRASDIIDEYQSIYLPEKNKPKATIIPKIPETTHVSDGNT